MKEAETFAEQGNYYEAVLKFQSILSRPSIYNTLHDTNKADLHVALGKVMRGIALS